MICILPKLLLIHSYDSFVGIVKGKTVVSARRIKIGHFKDLISSYIDKIEGILQGEINAPKLYNANKKFTRNLSSSLALLADLGITTILEENLVTFKSRCKELNFLIPDNLVSLYNVVELMRRGATYGFEVIPFDSKPITDKYVMLSEKFVKLYDGTLFYLDSIDPSVITETFFLRIHDNFSFEDKIVLDIGAAFGDTAIRFAKQGATVVAVEPANFEWLTKNIALNKTIADKIIPLNVAAGKNGQVEIERVSAFSFDGEARIHGTNRVHSKETIMLPGLSVKNIITKAGFNSVHYLKSDCKGCESFFSTEDYNLIKSGVEIECSANNAILVLEGLKSAEFDTVMWHYESNNHESLNFNGSILGRRIV